jgi:MFS family permease
VTSTIPACARSIVRALAARDDVGSVALISLFAFEALAVSTAMPSAATTWAGIELYALAFGAPLAAGCWAWSRPVPGATDADPGPAMWWGLAAFLVGVVVAGAAPTMTVLVAGRTLQGAGSGAVIVALYVLVARCYPEELHPRIFAAFSTAWVVPSLVGPPVAGLVAEHLGWRWVFLAVPLGSCRRRCCCAHPLAGLSRPVDDEPHEPTPIGWAACAAVSAGALHLAGQRSMQSVSCCWWPGWPGWRWRCPSCFPAGSFRAARGLPAVVALRGLFAAGFFSAEVFIPLLLTRERGLSPALAGAALTVGALSWAAGSNLQARVSRPETRPLLLALEDCWWRSPWPAPPRPRRCRSR